jgi:fucose permease
MSAGKTPRGAGNTVPHPPLSLQSPSTLALSLLFAATGVGSALLGSALPAFLAHWSLSDRGGGLLFFMAWLGAALGALLSRGNLAHSVVRGAAVTALACGFLIPSGRVAVFPLMFCYGLGLGIIMTSISRLRSQTEHSRRTQELNRLNLLWALGALACPTLAAHALFTASITYLFAIAGCAFAVLGVWAFFTETRMPPVTFVQATGGKSVPAVLCLISGLIVGVEASLGGWLTTYTKRTDHSITGAVTATSAFWAGLLLSRAFNSTPWSLRADGTRALQLYSALVAVSLCLLAIAHRPGALLALAFGLGFGLGPLYPLLLALVLPRFRGNRIFFFAGFGSALLPWFTGVLSTGAGSLRAGLAVPCAAGCLLLGLVWWTFGRDAQAWTPVEGTSLNR